VPTSAEHPGGAGAGSQGAAPWVPRAVLFDFAGVLTEPLTQVFLETAAQAGVAAEQLASVLLPMFMSGADSDLPAHRWERGEIGLDEFLAGLDPATADVARLLDPASPDYVIGRFRAHPGMVSFAGEVRAAGFRTAVVSNVVREWGPRWDEILGATAGFDEVIYSYEVGVRKPSRAIFDVVLGRLGVDAGEALYLEDSASMVAAAAGFGIRAIHVDDHDRAIAEARRICFPQPG